MKRYFTILILCCLFGAACGLTGSERSAKKLVSAADAEKIMGVPAIFDGEKLDVRQTNCYYRDAEGKPRMRLQVTIQEYESEDQSKDAHESMRAIKGQYAEIQPVEGVGDAAWFEDHEYSQAIYVRRKNIEFFLSVEGGENSARRRGELRRVAQSVAERL